MTREFLDNANHQWSSYEDIQGFAGSHLRQCGNIIKKACRLFPDRFVSTVHEQVCGSLGIRFNEYTKMRNAFLMYEVVAAILGKVPNEGLGEDDTVNIALLIDDVVQKFPEDSLHTALPHTIRNFLLDACDLRKREGIEDNMLDILICSMKQLVSRLGDIRFKSEHLLPGDNRNGKRRRTVRS